ncbi:MAG: beta-N-acetylhexosaminidase [Lachnospiraceae bacterium]|nr:beta-N-acetylhexosaminidase [Lachnospiraceae bacterium]
MAEEVKKPDVNSEDRREFRRRRRQRNQILAYSVLIGIMILFAGGIVTGIHLISNRQKERETSIQMTQAAVEEILQSEEELEFTEEPESIPEETVVELTYEQKLDQVVNAAIEVMPIEDKVAGLFCVTPEAITGVSKVVQAGDATREALSKYAVGGIVYSAKNVKNHDTFKGMLDNTVLYSKYPVFLAMEEESGSAAQLVKLKIGEKTDDAKTIGASGDPANAYQAGSTIGTYLEELGINLNFAPVADLNSVDKSVMAARSFGSDAGTVVGYTENMLQGIADHGLTACVKHFPGMGSVTSDPAKGVVVSKRTEEEFRANEFVVFQTLVEDRVPMIMVRNMSAPGLVGEDDNTPCSLSAHVVTDILRKEMGYDGVVITDALNEKAISDYYTSDVAAIMALKAGCDMILAPENFEQAYNGILKAVEEGTISEARVDDALRRIYRIKFADRVE